ADARGGILRPMARVILAAAPTPAAALRCTGCFLAAADVGAAGEGGPGGPVGAVVGDDDGGLGVAQRVVGGQRAVVRVDLPVAALADRASGELLAAGFGHRDLGGHECLGL